MICALYARVSTSDQSCDLQLEELRGYAKRMKWTVSAEYTDHGWSGSRRDRPQLVKLMVDAAQHKFDTVLVWKLDRFGRSTIDLMDNIERLKTSKVRFICVSQGIDTEGAGAAANLFMTVLAAIAEFERELYRERIKAGLDHARRVGTRSGKPIGGQTKIFRRDEVRRLKAEGVPVREIARRFGIGVGTVMRTCSTELPVAKGNAVASTGLPKAASNAR